MDTPSDILARVKKAAGDAWRDHIQWARDRDGYLRRLAAETIALKAGEASARRDYQEAVTYYQGAAWKADGVPVEVVTRLLDTLKAVLDKAINARVERQWDLEEAVKQAFPPDDYDTQSLLEREKLLDEAVQHARSIPRPDRPSSPLAKMVAEQRDQRHHNPPAPRPDVEPVME
ncbi:MAG: hypothetical protein R3D33_18545 [Hyphomicrobiaceae bacterium]